MKKIKELAISVWGVFFLFLVTRIAAYIGNPVPTGYDAGIYLHIIKTFPALDQWLQSGFSPGTFILTLPFAKLGVPPEALLIPLLFFSQIALFAAIYFGVKSIAGKKAALWTTFLFTFAPIQYRVFWYFYIKNTFGLAFLILTISAISKRSLLYTVIFGVLVALFHLPMALVLALILAVEFVIHKGHRTFYLKSAVGIGIVSAVYYLPRFSAVIAPNLPWLIQSTIVSKVITNTLSQSVYGGAFYTLGQSLPLMILYLPIVAWALYLYAKGRLKEYRTIVVAFLITLTLVVTHYSFYQRFIIPMDLFAICLAGAGLDYFFHKFDKNKDAVGAIRFYCAVCVVVLAAFIIKTGQPLITATNLNEICTFKTQTQGQTYILSTAKEDPAWLLGYTDYPIIAWDFGGYDIYWTNDQWQEFFGTPSVEEKISLLKSLPSPLYLYINDTILPTLDGLEKDPCITQLSPHFYHFTCPNINNENKLKK